jgi:hypothetical protein
MAIRPLSAVEPLAIATISDTGLVTREITIGELSVAPIIVEPLPPGGTDTTQREDR